MGFLTDAKEGSEVRIISMDCCRGIKNRLYSVGLYGGSIAKIKKNDGRGPVVIEALGSNFAIGRGQARRIQIEET